MWTVPVSVAKTTVLASTRRTCQAASDGAGKPESAKSVRSAASLGSEKATRSWPVEGSLGLSRNFALRSSARTSVPPRLEKTKRTSGVSSSTFCSGWFAAPAPGAGGAVAVAGSGGGAGAAGALWGAAGAGAGCCCGTSLLQTSMNATQRAIATMSRFSMFFTPRAEAIPAGEPGLYHPGRTVGSGEAASMPTSPRGPRRASGSPPRRTPSRKARTGSAAPAPARSRAGRSRAGRGGPPSRRASQAAGERGQLAADGGVVGARRGRTRHHDQIETCRKLGTAAPVTVANPALHAVAQHGSPHLLANGDSDPTPAGN